jgi:hypothetical protein
MSQCTLAGACRREGTWQQPWRTVGRSAKFNAKQMQMHMHMHFTRCRLLVPVSDTPNSPWSRAGADAELPWLAPCDLICERLAQEPCAFTCCLSKDARLRSAGQGSDTSDDSFLSTTESLTCNRYGTSCVQTPLKSVGWRTTRVGSFRIALLAACQHMSVRKHKHLGMVEKLVVS